MRRYTPSVGCVDLYRVRVGVRGPETRRQPVGAAEARYCRIPSVGRAGFRFFSGEGWRSACGALPSAYRGDRGEACTRVCLGPVTSVLGPSGPLVLLYKTRWENCSTGGAGGVGGATAPRPASAPLGGARRGARLSPLVARHFLVRDHPVVGRQEHPGRVVCHERCGLDVEVPEHLVGAPAPDEPYDVSIHPR